MIFRPTALRGVWLIALDKRSDERGYFARTWCAREFAEHGLNPGLAQCNTSFNARKGTLRGMHFQTAPFEEAKLVRCARGAIFDVAIDLRPSSPTYARHVSATLTAEGGDMLYIPEGCAHGFLTLADHTEVFYQMSQFYAPDHGAGARWNDPAFGIDWPIPVSVISPRDAGYPDFAHGSD
jgi:dTDP-4-dehydrorhamnose 3,5-epimerase